MLVLGHNQCPLSTQSRPSHDWRRIGALNVRYGWKADIRAPNLESVCIWPWANRLLPELDAEARAERAVLRTIYFDSMRDVSHTPDCWLRG
jgi:hypothetical protein